MNKMKEDEEPNRTKQLGLRVKESFYWKVKEMALKRRCHIVELIEESVDFFQNTEREREREREQKRPRNYKYKNLKISDENFL